MADTWILESVCDTDISPEFYEKLMDLRDEFFARWIARLIIQENGSFLRQTKPEITC